MSGVRTPWRAVASLFALNGALFGVWASRIPAVMEIHALEEADLGLLLLCMAVGAILAFPIIGRLCDKFGAAQVTRAIAAFYCAALFGLALALGVVVLGAALLLFGMAHGGMDVAMNAWAAEVERRAGTPMMSSFHAMFSLGAGLGAASGYGAVLLGLGLAAHFALASLAIGAYGLAMAAIPWESDRAERREGAPIFQIPHGILALVGLVAFCSALGEGAMADWSAYFLVTALGADEAQATLGFAVFSVAMVAARLSGDRVVARTGPLRAARASGAIAALGVALAVLIGDYWAALAGFALMGIGYAVIFPLAYSRAANDGVTPPGEALASVATLGYGGILLGPPVIGFAAEATSIKAAFAILFVLALMMAALAGVLVRRG